MTELSPSELDAMYRDVFESDRRGAAILEDLIRHFVRAPARGFSQDAVFETFVRSHQRAVLDFVISRINRANGVAPDPAEEVDQA